MKKKLSVSLTLMALLSACGGGGSGGSGGSDSSAYKATTAGPGSTVASSEIAVTGGSIRYAQYQSTNTRISDKASSIPNISATINFNSTSKQGSIQFSAVNGTELISTSNAYTTTSWTGPFSAGTYKFNGNILVGCNSSAATYAETTQVFVSSSLERVVDGALDDIYGLTFDVFNCSLLQQSKVETLKVNADGSLFMSITNSTLPKNQAFDMLNPEKYPAVAISNANSLTDGFYSGQVFKYGANGVNKYAIVIQTNAAMTPATFAPTVGNAPYPYHYFIAIQR